MAYRLAPEVHGETPAEDVLTGLTWLIDQPMSWEWTRRASGSFGHSSGAGIAAGAAVLARDRGVPLAHQILLYPMLDDRTTEPDPHLAPTALWTYDSNSIGWGELRGGDPPGPITAPARLEDATGLPPTYIEGGELDIFRDECVAYVSKPRSRPDVRPQLDGCRSASSRG